MPIPRGPFKPIPLTAKAEILMTITGSTRPIAVVLHIRETAAPTAAVLLEHATAIGAAIAATPGATPNNVTVGDVVVTDLNSSSGPQVRYGVNMVGTGDACVPDQAAVVELTTIKRGRSYNGKAFWPVPEDQVTAGTGVVGAVFIGRITTVFDAMEANLIAAATTSNLVVASRKLSTSQDLDDATVRPIYGRVRRRLFG